MRNVVILLVFLCSICITSCGEDTLPKPKAYLSLEYPIASYEQATSSCNYAFEKNNVSKVTFKNDCSAVVDYPELDGTIFLTYRNVNGNINKLLKDAQKLTYEHVIKADDIWEDRFVNEKNNTFGMFYDVEGNAASQSQFYVTDSTRHFITGSIYFNAKPNYDSILPAAAYLKNDIRRLMETIEWRDNE